MAARACSRGMDAVAATQVQQILAGFFAHLSDVCDATGNTITGPMCQDRIIDALERVDISFDEDGNHGMQVVVPPGAAEALRRRDHPPRSNSPAWRR